ncbi:MAG: GHKL domain-containing protein [Oscillospiraceae bacterium]|nr:GHKL domain-containing protein [Oscillospiraceae bacterium]
MTFVSLLSIFNYGLVLVYGLFLSIQISGGWTHPQQKRLTMVLCPLFLLAQAICGVLWGIPVTRKLYPLMVHLPLVLILVRVLKKRLGEALVSVCTAYLCCQLPRWIKLLVMILTGSHLLGEICYTLVIGPIYWLLHRYFVRVAHDAMTDSSRTLFLFGSLPFVYYIFDYATTVYSDALYAGIPALTEFFSTALVLFYVAFLTAYHAQLQKRTQTELQKSMLESELKQSGVELESLRRVENQTATYQHNMRHHLTAINAFLSAGNVQQAQAYIKTVQTDVEAITPKRFCENELVNLLCSAFLSKAEQLGVSLKLETRLPKKLPISDTELCTILSNALENALCAASKLEEGEKWISLYCGIRFQKLLIEIKNPFSGRILLQDGLPVSQRAGHGYGCRSIRSIVRQHEGLCTFETEGQVFIVRIVVPLQRPPHDRPAKQPE